MAGRKVRRPEATLAVPDHNVPTTDRSVGIEDEESRIQVETLARNCADFGVPIFDMHDVRQGIVHIIGPEQGFTLPGMTIVCGDSATLRHPRRLRRAGLRHRHLRGGARAGDPDADPAAGQEHAHQCRRDAAAGRHRQGPDPRHHRQDRHRRRHRPCHRICRTGDPRSVHGRPHDGLQHVHRGRRPGRPDRPGRDHLRLHQGPAHGAQGRGLGTGGRPLADAALRRGRDLRQGGDPGDRRDRRRR